MQSEVISGDCLEVLPDVDTSGCQLVLADLPYGITACKWDSVIDLERYWEIVKGIDPVSVMFCAQPFTSALVMSNVKQFRYSLVWEKTKATGHLQSRTRPLRAHEDVVVFWNGKARTYNPQFTKGKAYSGTNRPGSKVNIGKLYGDYHGHRNDNPGIRYPRSVVRMSAKRITAHPTEKPVKLLRWLIRTYTNPGDLVIDPTCGCGSSGIAAAIEDRRYIGIEMNAEYAERAREMIEMHGRKCQKELEL